ncbi:MarR family winged helix-turn-helix transcriptional regulator [Microlunatus capsulatus]|uniref:DNA-binding MarR family transcriptional regulator n=1 Tax=Microlunatus capsulatus TaxID=99117 RepID=A0ABS4ZCV4_9ACTN|nr:MarR family winged helix-turn-helix transcriptional regulator [Microlunatus capsulatus]MBP2418898.1 DNA-binding MarR family transcriptional regulator [Microlunatus capsulatus]
MAEKDDLLLFDEGRVSHVIFQLARAHRGYAATLLRQLGLHPGQELILMHLFARDAQTQSELLASIGLDHSTLSKALRRMQEAGLLTREPATHDRRVLVVRLTHQGQAMRGPIKDMWHTLEATTLQNLSPQQAQALTDSAQAVIDAINGQTHLPDPTRDEPS